MRNRIKALRKKNGDTLKNLANKINYDYSNLSKIERGKYEPSLELLRKIAETYQVDMSYFFEKDEECPIEENQIIGELDLCREEILNKYRLMIDGKKLTNTEIEFVIEAIRKLRTSIDENLNRIFFRDH
jgi:transcriptional regulator with XRE-family HTH domain